METDQSTNQPPTTDSPDVAGCPAPLCSPVRFNVNDYVRARITPHGEKCLRKNYDELAESFGGKLPFEFRLPEKDADGWTRFQMHDFMREFGRHIYCGCEVPFETEIEILIRENADLRQDAESERGT